MMEKVMIVINIDITKPIETIQSLVTSHLIATNESGCLIQSYWVGLTDKSNGQLKMEVVRKRKDTAEETKNE